MTQKKKKKKGEGEEGETLGVSRRSQTFSHREKKREKG